LHRQVRRQIRVVKAAEVAIAPDGFAACGLIGFIRRMRHGLQASASA